MRSPTSKGDAGSIYAGRFRITTIGIIVLMTIIAFEAMAVATALPTAARSLHGLAAYGWSFTGFLVASIVGMVVSGMYSDLRGPRAPLTVGLTIFISGLVLASLAPAMWVLVLARVLQGLATGLLITAMYVTMGEVYPDSLRPRMFAALAGAWVVPGLVGPVVAGWITEQLSWRWVFGGLAPFAAIGGVMMLPAIRTLRRHGAHGSLASPARIGYAVLAAAGIAGLANLGENHSAGSLVLGVLALGSTVIGMRRLLPRGTARFRAGVPAAVAYRGVLAGVFFGMESIVPLTLTVQHHYSPTLSGMPLMLTALTWAAGSQIQSRLAVTARPLLVRAGLLCIGVAGLGMALVAARTLPGWGAFVAWPIGGLGAGFALTSASVALLEFTNDADRGRDSSSLQLADSGASALCTAFSGAFVAAAAHGSLSYATGLSVVFVVMAVLAWLTLPRAGRLTPRTRSADAATGAAHGQAATGLPVTT